MVPSSTCQNRPTKWDYKLWCRAGVSGYVYDFEILGSAEAKGPPPPGVEVPKLGKSSNVILRLTKDLESKKHQVFFRQFFLLPTTSCFPKIPTYFCCCYSKIQP